MAKSTKNARRLPKKGNYKRVTTYKNGGNVAELNYSERREYIEKNYAPLIEEASMLFTISGSQFAYDYKGDRNKIVDEIIEHYTSISDYTEKTLPQETIYEIQDWDLVRKEIDPENDEVIGETTLEEVSADNSYNFSYLGLVDLNWRVYYDDLYERYFYVIMPHLGGDIRGNYGDAFILEGNDKEELFYRFYEEFLQAFAVIYFSFKDGSEIGFDSEQDSDVFYFRENEVFEPTGIAQKYLNDFEKFDTWYGDEFLEETIDVFLMQKGVAPKMMAGGDIYSDTPKAYIEVLGYDEGKWIDLTDYTDGMDVIDNISDWMSELNKQFGGNREEFRVADFEGFGNDLYDEYMGSNEFDEIIEAYEKFKSSDFPVDVISAYRIESGSKNDTLGDVIDEMENNYFGKYDSYTDFGYEMVEQGVYEPSDYDVYITETDKRIVAGEEADYVVGDMDFEAVLKFAKRTNSEYEDEKSELEDKIVELQEEIRDLTALQNDTENDQEYETISDEIEAKEIELEEAEDSYTNIDSRYEDNARQEAITVFYDEIYERLDNDLSSWLEDNGYTDDLTNVNFISIDYEKIGDEISSDYLVVEYDGELYFFTNYSNGGRISADKKTPQYEFYIVESNTKKIVSGYPSKEDALAQRKLLVEQYPSMRFELFTLGNLKAKTDLDVTSKSDYVELSTLDKIKKVSVDAYRYGKEKVGQANEFLVRNDVKGKIKRGSKKVYDKTKQGFNWMKRQWEEADFGDGKGKAKFFNNGGEIEVGNLVIGKAGSRIPAKEVGEVIELNGDEAVVDWIYGLGQSKTHKISELMFAGKGAKGFSDGGGVVWVDNFELDQDKINRAKYIINYNRGNYTIIDNKTKKAITSFPTQISAVNYINTELNKFADGGMAGLSDVSAMLPNPLPMSTIVAMGDGGILGEIYGKKDGGNKIDIFYKTSKGEHHYLNSTNSSKTIKEAVEKYKKILKGDSQTSFAERKRINRLEGKFDDGGVVGQEIVFDDSGERNTGVIREITNLGDYVVATDDDRTVLADRELDVISFGKMRKKVKEVEEKRGFFGLFDEGGDTSKKKGYDVYDNKRMLENQANEVEHHSEELNAQVKLTKKVPAWVIAKMERATTDLSDITHYLDGENKMSNGGAIGGNDYEIVAFPKSDKFVIATLNPNKNVIRDFSGKPMMFDSINSAQDFIDNLDVKYPYGIPKANLGMIMLASELLKAPPQQQPQQPQVVYSVPQPAELTAEEIGITQDIPEMDLGGETVNQKWTNDFCITNLIELANEIQPIKYFVTDRFDADSMESKSYKGKLVIVFKEMASIRVIDAINKFIERAEDCHDVFEQSVNFSSKQKNSISINLLTDDYSDTEFHRGGKVYEFAPKKINLSKTKKIRTNLGDYNLGLITNDFVYFVNLEEGDDNAQTIMYNKNGDLLSDNIFATNDLFETLETEDTFEFIHPELEKYKAEYTQDN